MNSLDVHRALGKVILFGEHAVVYGHPAIAGAVEQFVSARVRFKNEELSTFSAPAWNLDCSWDLRRPGECEATSLALAVCSITGEIFGSEGGSGSGEGSETIPALDILIETNLPVAAGLGSSAALCVSLTRAVLALAKKESTLAVVERLANLGENAFHASASGIDVALSARGGLGIFSKNQGLQPIDCHPLPLVIGLSGVPRATSQMVNRIAKARDENFDDTNEVLNTIGRITEDAHVALQENDWPTVGRLMTACYTELAKLDVTTAVLDEMVHCAQENGALGAKLTGAGGGGAVIALAPGNEEKVRGAWESAGYTAFVSTVGVLS